MDRCMSSSSWVITEYMCDWNVIEEIDETVPPKQPLDQAVLS